MAIPLSPGRRPRRRIPTPCSHLPQRTSPSRTSILPAESLLSDAQNSTVAHDLPSFAASSKHDNPEACRIPRHLRGHPEGTPSLRLGTRRAVRHPAPALGTRSGSPIRGATPGYPPEGWVQTAPPQARRAGVPSRAGAPRGGPGGADTRHKPFRQVTPLQKTKAPRREGLRALVKSVLPLGPVTSLLPLADTRAVARRCLVVARRDHESPGAGCALSEVLRVMARIIPDPTESSRGISCTRRRSL